jgi:hypothetical protein
MSLFSDKSTITSSMVFLASSKRETAIDLYGDFEPASVDLWTERVLGALV